MDIKEINKTQLQTMSANIKLLRETKSLSVEQLAKMAGIKPEILIEIEEGIIREGFLVKHLFELCDIFNIKPHEIFDRDIR